MARWGRIGAHHVRECTARSLGLDNGAHSRDPCRGGSQRREAKIGQPHVLLITQQDILELEIAMHEARGVQLVEACGHLLEHAQAVEHCDGPAHTALREELLMQAAAALEAHNETEKIWRRAQTRVGVGARARASAGC